VENSAWNPDQPDATDNYRVAFSFSDFKHKNPEAKLYYSFDAVKYFPAGSGTFELNFPRGARTRTNGVMIRPFLVNSQGQLINITGGADIVLNLEVVGQQ
jgi:hypothetical protein